MWELIAIPQVDMSLLPLSLPVANGINNGGYTVPSFEGNWKLSSKNVYSPIDLLVAGLEAKRRNIFITSLVSFFDMNRNGLSSETEIYIILQNEKQILTKNISWLKYLSIENKQLLKIMSRNAPLTFKWVR